MSSIPQREDYDSFDGYVDALESAIAEANDNVKIWQTQASEAVRQVKAIDSLYRKICGERDEWMTSATVAERQAEEAKDLYHKLHQHEREKCETDSLIGSCDCMTKTPEAKYHKPGCRYRLISERNEAVQSRDEAAMILKLIVDDLPTKRDWLNPTTEEWAREIVTHHCMMKKN